MTLAAATKEPKVQPESANLLSRISYVVFNEFINNLVQENMRLSIFIHSPLSKSTNIM